MEEKKTPRAKLHSGGHKKFRTVRGVQYSPHAPHPKPVPLTANQKKFQKSAKESDADYAKRTGLPARKKGEKIESYAGRLGVTADKRPTGRGYHKVDYDGQIYKKIARQYGAVADGKPLSSFMPKPVKTKFGISKKMRERNARRVASLTKAFNSANTGAKNRTAAVAAAKKQEAARVAAAKKAAAAKAAAQKAAVAKQKKEFEAAQKAEAAAFSAAKAQATVADTSAPSAPQPITPTGGTMAKQTTDTSKGTSGGVTKAASLAGSVAVTGGSRAKDAPIVSTEAPKVVAPRVAAALMDTEGTYTEEKDIKQLDEAQDATAPTIEAPEMDAVRLQSETKEVIAPEDIEAATIGAKTISKKQDVEAARGTVYEEAIAEADEATLTERAETAERDTEAEQAALAEAPEFDRSADAEVEQVTGEKAKVDPTVEVEAKQREAILGEPADAGQASQIIDTVGYTASQMRTVKGKAAKGAAAECFLK